MESPDRAARVGGNPDSDATEPPTDRTSAVKTMKVDPQTQGTGKSRKEERNGEQHSTDPLAVSPQGEGRQTAEKKRKRSREEKERARAWKRALREKEAEYWDALYDRGRRMVLGMGLPHDPLRGIQLLRRAAREARHAPARWDLQCLMSIRVLDDNEAEGKPVGLTDDSEAEAQSQDEDQDSRGSTTTKNARKGMKELEEEEEEEEDEPSSTKREEKKDKKKKKEKEKKKKDKSERAEEKKQKKRKKRRKEPEQGECVDGDCRPTCTQPSVGSSAGSLRPEPADDLLRRSANADAPADDDYDDDWEYRSDDDGDENEDEITDAEFQEVIAAIQRVRLTALQRLGATQFLNNVAAASRLGVYDMSDGATGRRRYEMDWAKAVEIYRRYVTPQLFDDVNRNSGALVRNRSRDSGHRNGVRKVHNQREKEEKGKNATHRGAKRVNSRWERIAAYNLGLSYYNGQGPTQDVVLAAQLFQRAADLGYVNGINSLGLCYYRGQGVELNIDKALSLFKTAADRGYMIAQYNLGNCLGTGANGIYEKNVTTSACLYLRSACQGDVAAFAHLLAITRNPQYFGKKEVEFVVPTLFNQCLAKCWQEGLFGRHWWEQNEGRRDSATEPHTEERQRTAKSTRKQRQKEKKRKKHKKQKLSQSSLERTETAEERGDNGNGEGDEERMPESPEAEDDRRRHRTKGKQKMGEAATAATKAKTTAAKERKGKMEGKRCKAKAKAKKARHRLEAAERASEERRDRLPQEIVARMYERRNTCVRPECEQQFWGKGRVMWKFPLFLPASMLSSSSSSSSPSSPTSLSATETTTPALLSLLSPPATGPPGFGSVEEMVSRYLIYFEEEDRMEATATTGEDDNDAQHRQPNNADADPQGDGNSYTSAAGGAPDPASATGPPEGSVVWRKLLLPFCSVRCSQLTTTTT